MRRWLCLFQTGTAENKEAYERKLVENIFERAVCGGHDACARRKRRFHGNDPGIYDKLITSVSSFFACKKRNALFLLLFALGGGAGMLLFANPLLYLLERYPLVLRWFFIGAVAGSTPMMLKKAQIHIVSWRLPVFLVVGFSAVALFSFCQQQTPPERKIPARCF
ncbi:MAG: undecaprenyl phosphate translocase family protein [Ruthenibacterium lactatiformans]